MSEPSWQILTREVSEPKLKIIKKIKIPQVVDIQCDVCGKSCYKHGTLESANLKASWGYYSSKDGTSYDIDLCEDCFDNTLHYIKSISQV